MNPRSARKLPRPLGPAGRTGLTRSSTAPEGTPQYDLDDVIARSRAATELGTWVGRLVSRTLGDDEQAPRDARDFADDRDRGLWLIAGGRTGAERQHQPGHCADQRRRSLRHASICTGPRPGMPSEAGLRVLRSRAAMRGRHGMCGVHRVRQPVRRPSKRRMRANLRTQVTDRARHSRVHGARALLQAGRAPAGRLPLSLRVPVALRPRVPPPPSRR